jgi:CBS domain-containing protein
MSPRAASRLETLGCPSVYDYVAGKADWGAFGLPLEGQADSSTRVSSAAATDVPTCRLDELLSDVAACLPDDWDICVVINEENTVLGTLGRSALHSNPQTTVEEAMTAGPSTIRPSARLDDIANRMRDQKLTRIIVTRSDGRLFGVVRAQDIERTLRHAPVNH